MHDGHLRKITPRCAPRAPSCTHAPRLDARSGAYLALVQTPSQIEPATVLLVEDDDATAYWVRRVLSQHGAHDAAPPRVLRAATLAEALPELRRADCVLADLTLPDSRGIETFLALHHAAPAVPIVVLTSLRDEELGAEAVRLGAQDFLSKDSAPEQISRAVRFALLRGRWQGAVDEAARLEAVLDSISDAYLAVDGGGRLTYANRAAERLFGVRRGDAVGRPLAEGIPALAGTRTLAALLAGGGEPAHELEECLPSIGRWVEMRLFPSPAGTTAYLRDTTERRRTEEALREAERFTAGLLSNLPGMAYRCANDPQWTMEFASEGAQELTGFPPGALLGPGGVAYGGLIHPDDRDSVWSAVQEAVRQGRPFELSYRIVTADGHEKWVWEQGRGVRGADGEVRVVEGFITDTTRQKALEEQLRQAQKMDALGRLAGGIAHDFNNLLTAIKGTAALMLLDLAPGDPLREDAEAIGEVVDRAAGLARQLLAFGRGHVVRRETVDLNAVVEETGKMLRRLIPGDGIELATVLAGELAPVNADAGQLEQVLVNLVLNARDAMPDGGTVIVETMNVEVDAWPRGWATGLAPGAYVMLVVHDTGTGIDARTQERIFEPFFTTKEVGQGTGLGLSIVYGIVQQSGGAVRVFSRPGAGTTFRVLLPRAGAPPRPRAPEPPPALPGSWSGTVLVVDDEPAVRRTTRRLLERAGFTVLEAGGGEEALGQARAHRGPLSLVVTDVVMPRMGGPELAAQLAAERPETPVLFVSGYSEENAFPGGSAAAQGRFLHKPFTVEGLMEAVGRLLGKGGN